MAKRASSAYLCGGTSLNDAIVKIAKECPSISTHQVQRIIEFANTETFQRLFEKQAGDKNVEFDLADPVAIMKDIEDGARPSSMTPSPGDYDVGPVKLASANEAEADMILASAFGVDLQPPGVEKTAGFMGGLPGGTGGAGMPMSAPVQGPQADAEQATQTEEEHQQQMRTVSREIELEEKRQELASLRQKGQEASQPPAPEGPPAPPGAGPVEAAPPPQGPPPGPPPAAGPPMPKTAADLTKEAAAYVNARRPEYEMVLKDLEAATSLDRIKEATQGDYPMANPFGPLIRAKQKLAHLLDDATYAEAKNRELHKEALARFTHTVTQHMLDGGQLGEVAHAMASVPAGEEHTKLALQSVIPHLLERGLDPVASQAENIAYEMEKGARMRPVNPDHPIVESFANLHKLAEGYAVLSTSRRELEAKFNEVESVLKEAAVHESASIQ
jgi:hypothetical protein